MSKLVYVTGNKNKAAQVQKYSPVELEIVDIDLEEIQETNAKIVAEHKVREAYKKLNQPVFVEDTSLEIEALKGLPGALVKWFVKSLELETICRMIDPFNNRRAVKRNIFAYYDGGDEVKFFIGSIEGRIAKSPRGTNGFGFDPIFIPAEQQLTNAEMDEATFENYSSRKIGLKEMGEYFKVTIGLSNLFSSYKISIR